MSKFPAILATSLACLLFLPACSKQPAEPVIDDAYFVLLERHFEKIKSKCDALRYPLVSDTPWEDIQASLEEIQKLADVRASELAPLRPSIPDSVKYTDSLARKDRLVSLRSDVRRLLQLSILSMKEEDFEAAKDHLKTTEVGFNDASELCEIHKPVK